MSHAAIVAREENRDGIIRRRNSAVNSNMVTIMKDNISVRSIENYRSTDSQVGIVSFPCDFDHMYASMTEGMVASKEKNKYKYLKEICLQHLDLIQQQSEIIAKQEKQIQSLRLENGKVNFILCPVLTVGKVDKNVLLLVHVVAVCCTWKNLSGSRVFELVTGKFMGDFSSRTALVGLIVLLTNPKRLSATKRSVVIGNGE